MARGSRVAVVGHGPAAERSARALADAGFDVETADTAAPTRSHTADCIVATDANARAAADAAGDTPVLALAADDDPTDLLDAGVHDVVRANESGFETLLVARVEHVLDRRAAERRATSEHERLEALFGQFPEPTIAYEFDDGDPVVTDANAAFTEAFGHDDPAGRRVDDLVVGDGKQVEAAVLNDKVARGHTLDREVVRATPDGDRVFWLRNIPLDATPPAGFAVYTDVTERLRERERAQAFLNSSRDIVAIADYDTTYTYVSAAVEHVFGYRPSDLVGERALERIHEADRERVRQQLDSVGDHPVTIEFRGRHADGDWRWIEAVVTDQRDNPLIDGYLVNARDVTDRKRREREHRRQARIIATLHSVAVDIETAGSPDAVYQSLVDAAEGVLDYQICIVDERDGDRLVVVAASDDTPDEHYYNYVSVDAEDNLAAKVARTRETVVVDDLHETSIDPANAAYRSIITVPLADYGVLQAAADEPDAFDDADREFTEILASHAVAALDRLDRERELERQTDRLEKFASVVSHDLRTPLQVAVGAIELARETGDLDRLDTADDALDRIDRLASDLLAWARGASLVEDTEPVNVAAAATDCWRDLDTENATLDVTDAVVDADPDRVRQLLSNLLRNAVEHGATDPPSHAREDAAEHDGASVHVTVAPTEDGTGFAVTDDGPGVPDGERDAVFDAGHTTSTTGSGFGLDIARDIADAHGWTLTLDDDYTDGARFVVDCTTDR
ncbi:PAS domain-containing sensor histidine kinase [Halocalculus aciditolerans]|uniref:histidine kinase n=1 Tax=Halocalculus aciditolerans TaxID=1383812 RepID=A0A830F519_9EURY|nr:PAS domain S-box protein [Halocalculus aciditolerans]GGL63681.1 hypothetical protein GCM10009039_21990 [Halocalculus aciditolerans]